MELNNLLAYFYKIIFCNLARTLNSLGLLLDIVGIIIIYKYGLPEDIRRSGHSYLILEGEWVKQEIEKARIYDRWAKRGLLLVFLGFLLQLLSNYIY